MYFSQIFPIEVSSNIHGRQLQSCERSIAYVPSAYLFDAHMPYVIRYRHGSDFIIV